MIHDANRNREGIVYAELLAIISKEKHVSDTFFALFSALLCELDLLDKRVPDRDFHRTMVQAALREARAARALAAAEPERT